MHIVYYVVLGDIQTLKEENTNKNYIILYVLLKKN